MRSCVKNAASCRSSTSRGVASPLTGGAYPAARLISATVERPKDSARPGPEATCQPHWRPGPGALGPGPEPAYPYRRADLGPGRLHAPKKGWRPPPTGATTTQPSPPSRICSYQATTKGRPCASGGRWGPGPGWVAPTAVGRLGRRPARWAPPRGRAGRGGRDFAPRKAPGGLGSERTWSPPRTRKAPAAKGRMSRTCQPPAGNGSRTPRQRRRSPPLAPGPGPLWSGWAGG